MNRNWLYFILCLALFGIFVKLAIPVWFVFVIMAIFFLTKAIRRHSPAHAAVSLEKTMVFGVLGSYAVDCDPSDLSYGLYIQLDNRPVFIDIREDSQLEARKRRAMELHQHQNVLEEGLRRFKAANPQFLRSTVASIGLHASDLQQAEVFWDPDGYTLIRGFDFV